MRVETHLSGNLPRSEVLFRLLRRHSRGKTSWEEVRAGAERETIGWIYFIENNLTLVTDPMLLWHDHFRPFTENVVGMEVNGLSRWYDNNTFYKVPVIKSKLGLSEPFLDRYLFPTLLRGRKVKLILPDPLTMYRLSLNNGYSDESELVIDLSEVISTEAHRMVLKWALDVRLVQLTAPEMARRLSEDELVLVREIVGSFRKKFGCALQLHTCFFPAGRTLRSLLDSGADIVGIDLHATPVSALKGVDVDRELALGVVDARSVVVEEPNACASLAEKAVDATGARAVHLTANTDLEYLPVEVAKEKLRVLSECARLLRERWT
ncbi:MAG: hypothetical protein NZ957_04145 [Thaumarchaeota archaeon]|nr:hypothetical protein [Candidatus Calditenuaceae archaeon]MDW8041850.1 hypothetical protein [Nitrososphaerota archaeon]